MKNLSMKNFSLLEIYNNDKTKWKDYDSVCAINCTHKLTCMCACGCPCNCTHLRNGQTPTWVPVLTGIPQGYNTNPI